MVMPVTVEQKAKQRELAAITRRVIELSETDLGRINMADLRTAHNALKRATR